MGSYHFQNNLSTLQVSTLNLGTNQLTTGNEHKVLRSCGVPKVAEECLEKIMRLRSEEAESFEFLKKRELNQ